MEKYVIAFLSQHCTGKLGNLSVPSLVMNEKIIVNPKKLLIFIIIIFYQWQTPLKLTTIKLKITVWSVQLIIY